MPDIRDAIVGILEPEGYGASGVGHGAEALAKLRAGSMPCLILLRADVFAYDLSAALYHAWDVHRLTVEIGLGGGASIFDQRFTSSGTAKDQRALAPFTALHLATVAQLARGLFVALAVSAETHFMRIRERTDTEQLRVAFALRPTLGIGKHF